MFSRIFTLHDRMVSKMVRTIVLKEGLPLKAPSSCLWST